MVPRRALAIGAVSSAVVAVLLYNKVPQRLFKG